MLVTALQGCPPALTPGSDFHRRLPLSASALLNLAWAPTACTSLPTSLSRGATSSDRQPSQACILLTPRAPMLCSEPPQLSPARPRCPLYSALMALQPNFSRREVDEKEENKESLVLLRGISSAIPPTSLIPANKFVRCLLRVRRTGRELEAGSKKNV